MYNRIKLLNVNVNVDMNAELKGHGISNLISGITGGVPNYLCYSSSVTYFKCNGGSKYVLVCTVRAVRAVLYVLYVLYGLYVLYVLYVLVCAVRDI